MAETIFSRIIRGEIPCHRVYEDEHVLAFLDVGPLAHGHTLLVPKRAVQTIDELPDDEAAAIGRALPRICRAIRQVTGCAGFNILQNNGAIANQEVMHVHFHIIPKNDDGDGLELHWRPTDIDHEEAASLAMTLRNAINGESG